MKLFIYNDNAVKQWIVIKDDKPTCTFGYSPEELRRLGRFMAETITTQTKKVLLDVEYSDTHSFIENLGPDDSSAVYCDHANEVPMVCECPPMCYCQTHTCKDREKNK